MHLSRQPEPLYRELAAVLRDELQRMSPGDYLPAEVQLAARFAVNRHTLRRAVDELVLEGRLLRQQGKGTRVLAKPLIYPMQAGSAYSASLSALGHKVEAQLLESRLDTVAYRMGFGASRAESRQVVRHNGVLVNGKRVNIPSYEVRPGDVVELTERAKAHLRSKGALEAQASRGFPDWIDVDSKAARGVFKALPARTDLPSTINESLVVELYSR